MKISIVTLFPEMFSGPFDASIIQRAKEKNFVHLQFRNIREFGIGNHRLVDDRPFGGGTGMVLRVDVMDKAIQSVRDLSLQKHEEQCILLDARGKKFSQNDAVSFSQLQHLILVCGHYEGVDERIRSLVDATISIGDFIVTGGEIPAMIITDAVVRLVSGVLKEDATRYESFSANDNSTTVALEYPQFTQPRNYKGMQVPEILLSGNHKLIDEWKVCQSEEITKKHRPDLLNK